MRKLILIIFIVSQAACNSHKSNTDIDPKDQFNQVPILPVSEITDDQQAALDAINYLQRNTQFHLHSTFLRAEYPCVPPDTTFTVSRADLYSALVRFTDMYYDGSPLDIKSTVEVAAQAQEEYHVEHCYANPTDSTNYVRESGTWILRSVLNRRDVIIEW